MGTAELLECSPPTSLSMQSDCKTEIEKDSHEYPLLYLQQILASFIMLNELIMCLERSGDDFPVI